jgi:hypothetical protein
VFFRWSASGVFPLECQWQNNKYINTVSRKKAEIKQSGSDKLELLCTPKERLIMMLDC